MSKSWTTLVLLLLFFSTGCEAPFNRYEKVRVKGTSVTGTVVFCNFHISSVIYEDRVGQVHKEDFYNYELEKVN